MATITRAPFKMKGSRYAVHRRDGKFVVSGRASYVWESILKARAAGVPGVYEVRRSEKDAPWHRVDLTIEQAEELLSQWGIFGQRRVVQMRRMRESRAKRGLEIS